MEEAIACTAYPSSQRCCCKDVAFPRDFLLHLLPSFVENRKGNQEIVGESSSLKDFQLGWQLERDRMAYTHCNDETAGDLQPGIGCAIAIVFIDQALVHAAIPRRPRKPEVGLLLLRLVRLLARHELLLMLLLGLVLLLVGLWRIFCIAARRLFFVSLALRRRPGRSLGSVPQERTGNADRLQSPGKPEHWWDGTLERKAELTIDVVVVHREHCSSVYTVCPVTVIL